MKNVLVLVAHPDDEALGCGGSLLALHSSDRVTLVALADGTTSSNADLSFSAKQLSDRRRKMAEASAAILKIDDLIFLGMPDQKLDQLPLLEIVRMVQPVVDRVRPSVIYTHSQSDLNLDHRIAGEVALVISRPVPGNTIEELYAFEVPSSGWHFGQIGRVFSPNVFVDIQATMERKLKALAAYESELGSAPHPQSLEMIRAMSARMGSICGTPAAEAFELIRAIKRPTH